MPERSALRRWAPVVGWAAGIFLLSTDHFSGPSTGGFLLPLLGRLVPWASPEQLLAAHAAIRKLAHLTEYAVLSALWYRALVLGGRRPSDAHWRAAAGAALYAVTDEWHQSFQPTRTAAVGDVLIDAAGGVLAQIAIAVARTLRRSG